MSLIRSGLAVWAIALCCFTGLARAESAPGRAMRCPGNASEPLPSPSQAAAVAAKLAAFEPTCHNDVGYLAYRGAVLIQLGQAEAAAALLERALFIFPEHAGAQADYARALAALGDTRSASTLVNNLLERADMPASMRTHLEEWQRKLVGGATPDEWQAGGSFAVRAGRERNLNSAPSRNSLDLTLPDGTVSLPLADSYRTKSGGATLVEASLQADRGISGGGRLQLLADMRNRTAPGVSGTDYQQYELLGALTLPVLRGAEKIVRAVNQFNLGLSRLEFGGERLYEAERMGMAHIFQASTCLVGGNIDAETRRYPAASNLDGWFLGLGGSLRCPLGEGRANLVGRLGHDRPDEADRPGGVQRRADLRIAYSHPMRLGKIDAELSLGHQRDAGAYSDLIARGARRNMTRLGVRTEWTIPLSASLDGLITLEASRQRSNIALFDIEGAAFWLGMRWNWGK